MVEYHLKISHCKEELVLLERDMANYVKYYSSILSSLKSKLSNLEDFEEDQVEAEISYGYNAQLQEGMQFHTIQLKKGLQLFCNIISPDLLNGVDLIDLVVEVENDIDDADSSVTDVNDDILFESELDLDLVLTVGTESMYDAIIDDCLVGYNENCTYVFLPHSHSQSTINKRNGSSACSVISLLVGKFLSLSSILCKGFIFNNIFPVFLGCMEIGNIIYHEENLLSVKEAVSFMPDTVDLEITNERNCYPTTLDSLLTEFMIDLSNGEFVVIVACERTVCCVFTDTHVYIFDSHVHEENGAAIHSFTKENMSSISKTLNCSDDNLIYACVVKG